MKYFRAFAILNQQNNLCLKISGKIPHWNDKKFHSLFRNIKLRITYKSNLLAIRRPARNVNGPLPAIDVCNGFWNSSRRRHQPQVYLLIERMAGRIDVFWK